MGRKPKHNHVRYFRDPDLPQVELRCAHHELRTFREHSHETYSVALLIEGATTFTRMGREYPLVPGEVTLIEPDIVHACSPKMIQSSYRIFYIDAQWFESLAAQMAGQPPAPVIFPEPVVNHAPLYDAWESLYEALRDNAPRMQKQARLLAACAETLGSHAHITAAEEDDAELRAVARARQVLDSRPEERITLETLARDAGLSPSHLQRVFKKATGFTPHGYQLQRRVDLAKTLLRQGESIAQAAAATGFSDQSYFTKKFKAMTGSTPAQYRPQ